MNCKHKWKPINKYNDECILCGKKRHKAAMYVNNNQAINIAINKNDINYTLNKDIYMHLRIFGK